MPSITLSIGERQHVIIFSSLAYNLGCRLWVQKGSVYSVCPLSLFHGDGSSAGSARLQSEYNQEGRGEPAPEGSLARTGTSGVQLTAKDN